jgi:dipeptidase
MKKQMTLTRWMMTAIMVFIIPAFLNAQFIELTDEEASCTSIMVGKLASTDGSVITSHSCDGNYRTWLNIVPAAKHPAGTTRKVQWGLLHNETPWDTRRVYVKGEIPQVAETYAYYNVAYPAMNEKQLAMGETTISGRRELRNDDGLFLIEELQAIALERCTTARDAIRLMGELATKYGYADAGECLTVADKKEVWHFEIFGAGMLYNSAVWAAVRIPDDHVGVSANIPRISTIDLKKPDFYMASENVFSLAEEYGYWDSKSGEPFKFWKAYGGRTKAFAIREFYILSTLAPSLKLSLEAEELPFSVKPEKKLSIRDVFAYYREYYEGTEYDKTKNILIRQAGRRPTGDDAPADNAMVKSPVANPFMGGDMINLLNTLAPGTIENQRTIAVPQCSYSQVIQLREWLPDEIGGIAWFSFDNPGESPRIPIFAGVLNLPASFELCGQKKYSEDAAIWHFRRTNRLAEIKWGVTRQYIEAGVKELEDKAFAELPAIEKIALEMYNNAKDKPAELDQRGNPIPPAHRVFLTNYTNDFARIAMQRWWEMGNQFFTMFARGI